MIEVVGWLVVAAVCLAYAAVRTALRWRRNYTAPGIHHKRPRTAHKRRTGARGRAGGQCTDRRVLNELGRNHQTRSEEP